jgi:hypothetical protein
MFRHETIYYKDHAMEYKQEVVETSLKHNYKVPRILWENFEAVLLAQSKKYIEDLAKILEVPAKELQKRVMPSADSIKIALQDADEGVCQAYVQRDKFTVFCRKPVYHSTFCAEHTGNRLLIVADKAIPIQRIKDIETLPPLWVQDKTIMTADGGKIGKIDHDQQKIKIYVIDK